MLCQASPTNSTPIYNRTRVASLFDSLGDQLPEIELPACETPWLRNVIPNAQLRPIFPTTMHDRVFLNQAPTLMHESTSNHRTLTQRPALHRLSKTTGI
jgi:hypothetical protein